MLNFLDVVEAYKRISAYCCKTPLIQNSKVNEILGLSVFFKCEGFQRIGAFKARGALNFILQQKPGKDKMIVAYSSGNHAQAVAWAASLFNYKVKVYMPSNASQIKINNTHQLGAEVILCATRSEAEDLSAQEAAKGAILIPPYDDDSIICGQGTAVYEARIIDKCEPEIICVPLGGGGLFAGSYLAKAPSCEIVAGEPLLANDAVRSLNNGKIFRFKNSPLTIADGARTLSLSERTFAFLKKADDVYEFSEDEIIAATQFLMYHLKILVEPTSALAFLALRKRLQVKSYRKALVVLSGANIDRETMTKVWENNYL
ncbi:MAG: pyridoxal-phosphate dependent enzyme [Bdellovibrionales bacterium]|nr:pyridoxal-phosphate dependent enzyme [Bdellovibrionales bacterium]